MSLLWFVTSLVRVLERTIATKLAIPLLMKSTLKWMPVITSIPFWKITMKRAKHVGGFSFAEGQSPIGVALYMEFLGGELDGSEPSPFPLGSR